MGLFNSKSVVYRPVNDINLGPDSTEIYLQANVKAPRMTGILVMIFAWFLESRIFGTLLMYILKRDNLIHKLITDAELEEPPLYVPLHHFEDPMEQEIKCLDSALTPAEKVHVAVNCLPTYSEKALTETKDSFYRWTIMDYYKAYSSGDITPTMVAERFIAAVGESSRMGFFIDYNAGDILRQAKESTLRYQKGEPISVLDGIPVAIKDEIDCLPYPTTGNVKFFYHYSRAAENRGAT
ncbi:putative hydrolase [Lupinus albus]|uniref:Putative hydrolase n=1 Tax=Lupinus albus TaxID=3870 RepID=A0A6A4PN84_LUPAL|nr:putative hydrolase [Lupinus albus]